ncbi:MULTISPECIES: PepSY domain-containing protein [Ferrimonas]|uniref:PepSY domain-containing protein n=1 Tax=Ferrimonas TaxID=44011 RepID=UPI0009FFE66A|nr:MULTISPECIES: PepSY-associated TM helix domain-containing protein [Ferrimonas]USD38316.1 PepSY domain-containing protein [Ferrimonas sp. SCSIO 43195]
MKTRTLTRWHSKIGILVCVWILLLATTGLLLQHSHRIGLDQPSLTAPLWYRIAGVPEPKVTAIESLPLYQVEQALITPMGKVAELQGGLVAAIATPEVMLAADGQALYLLTREGELVERLPHGAGIQSLGLDDQGRPLLLDQQGQAWALDWWMEQAPQRSDAQLVSKGLLPQGAELPAELAGKGVGISVERLLLSLHTGRIFGPVGEWLMSLVALMAIAIACTGFVIWGRRR